MINDTLPEETLRLMQKRIEEELELIKQAKNKSTKAYISVMDSLKYHYEYIGDIENANKIAIELLNILENGKTELKDNELGSYLVSCYDTRARAGDFESFMIALEWNRPIEKQFYLPRRKILKKFGVVQAFQDVADGKVDFLCVNMPPRTGKSTLGLFFLLFMACLYPERSILGNGHSASLTQSFYNEILNMLTNDEYRISAIFPKINIVNKSSEYSYIDLNTVKRFHTLMFKSVDGGTTGLAEASNILYCDDLVKDVETANNIDRLDKLFYTYTSTIQDRKVQRKGKDGVYRPCPEIHINTPWSIHDVTSRLIQIYGDDGNNPRVRIISVPCYDENGESNFMYDYGKGFSKEYYHQLEMSEDPVIFSAKYLMKPIERDGRPFTQDQLSFYYEKPDTEPDCVCAYADVAHGGEDYFSMPIAYVYGQEVYIEDVVFVNKMGDDETRPLVRDKIIQHRVTRAGFEENNGGKPYADLVNIDLKMKNYHANITTHKARSNRSKLDRIMSRQNDIKGVATEYGTFKIYFKAESVRKDNKQYNDFMRNLYNWSSKQGAVQRTQHDDAPDSLAGLLTNVLDNYGVGKAKTINASKYL
jgi:hypothetical protein